MAKKLGKQTYLMQQPPCILSWAAVGGKREGEGPLGASFDWIEPDTTFGQDSWEKAESRMVMQTVSRALDKAALAADEIDCIFAGDLLNQCIGTTFGLRDTGIPLFGLYGACSTIGEGMALASLLVDAASVLHAMAVTSSHFCTAERQYRFPLEYGSVRPPTAQWTATASGAVILAAGDGPPYLRAATVGTIEDLGVTDQNNMGAAMAPAAAATLSRFFRDTGSSPEQFDLIATGDLGAIGSALLVDLLRRDGLEIQSRHTDCGLLIYDRGRQDVHAGGSGCGCSASVLGAYLLPALREGRIRNLLFLPTGALLSPTSVQQKESIPGIAHLVWLSHEKEGIV